MIESLEEAPTGREDEILPCPCGGQGWQVHSPTENGSIKRYIRCNVCGAQGGSANTREEGIMLWNNWVRAK